MARKRTHTPEEIVAKLRPVEVLLSQGKPATEAVRAIGVTEATYCRWRAEHGGLKLDRAKRLKQLPARRRSRRQRQPRNSVRNGGCRLLRGRALAA